MRNGLPIRTDVDAETLRRHARQRLNWRVAARLRAVADVLSGMSRKAAAEAAGMRSETLRKWIARYNEDGIAGLSDRPRRLP